MQARIFSALLGRQLEEGAAGAAIVGATVASAPVAGAPAAGAGAGSGAARVLERAMAQPPADAASPMEVPPSQAAAQPEVVCPACGYVFKSLKTYTGHVRDILQAKEQTRTAMWFEHLKLTTAVPPVPHLPVGVWQRKFLGPLLQLLPQAPV